jgi:hypothetical protein
MSEWWIQPGKPTYRYLKIKSVFLEPREAIKIWERKIISKLDNPASWAASVNTDFEPYEIRYKTDRRRGIDVIKITIGLYRDGFHIIPFFSNGELIRELYGQRNTFNIWTQETEKVPELIKDLLSRIEEYYKQ